MDGGLPVGQRFSLRSLGLLSVRDCLQIRKRKLEVEAACKNSHCTRIVAFRNEPSALLFGLSRQWRDHV
jgi:hypothetical protein